MAPTEQQQLARLTRRYFLFYLSSFSYQWVCIMALASQQHYGYEFSVYWIVKSLFFELLKSSVLYDISELIGCEAGIVRWTLLTLHTKKTHERFSWINSTFRFNLSSNCSNNPNSTWHLRTSPLAEDERNSKRMVYLGKGSLKSLTSFY